MIGFQGNCPFPPGFINPGDWALVPTPAYPVYHVGNAFRGGDPISCRYWMRMSSFRSCGYSSRHRRRAG